MAIHLPLIEDGRLLATNSLKFIGEYAMNSDVVSADYFELKELKIGVAL